MGKARRGASRQGVRERNERENREAVFWGRQMEWLGTCDGE